MPVSKPKRPKSPEAVEPATVSQRWCDLLAEEGFRPKAEQDKDAPERSRIFFKHEGINFSVHTDEKDPTYFQFQLGYTLEDPEDLITLLAAANLVNAEVKGAKVTVSPDRDSAWFVMEWFSDSLPSGTVLDRLIYQANHAATVFFEKRKELSHPEPQA